MATEKSDWWLLPFSFVLCLSVLQIPHMTTTLVAYLLSDFILATVLKWHFAPSHPPLLTLPSKLWATTVVTLMCREQNLLKYCDLTGSRWILSLECILPSFTYCYVCSSGYFSCYRWAIMFLVPGLHSVVIVTGHCKKRCHSIIIVEEQLILRLWNKLLWIHHENNPLGLDLSLTDQPSYCVIYS